ncbi:phosphoglycerate dehydrogenase [Sulfurospirillum sp. T05]|uniref:D-3-phosphoglycerate dehydrogenase n=1 Tax=Sulfurospirillum tamanense TaxID=2813362 RepID=A0ABS2WPK5_9BACT|nr:phosphoglycerate dehydrogenase [Sulfurospirillum tamanensis]MBN2963435.1 phosphoglycerate dehydrogenase [Sulfurospirillum tamanensis]
MYKIQTLNKIAEKGLDLLPHGQYEIASEFNEPDGIIVRSFKMHEMPFPISLKAIARAGAGVNNIPLERCSEKGIVVFNTPGANANAVKELVLCSMLLASRDVVGGVAWTKSLEAPADQIPALVEQGKANFAGCEIKGKTLGVVGLGAIGALVAKDALALGMNVIGYDPYLSVDGAWELSNDVQKASGLETLLKSADYLTIHVPLLPSTKEMYNAEKFAMMKPGIKIMNFARGELFKEDDLLDALESGQIGAYVTDFPTTKLIHAKGVIPVPHLGASTEESEENCAIWASRQLKNFLESGNIENSVNFPTCKLPMRKGIKRLSIVNKNIPNIIGTVTSLLAKEGINIDEMINQSKGDVAYMLLDVQGEISPSLIQALEKTEGIRRVRLILG